MALTAQQVQQFYIGYYGRPADPVGLTFWQTQTEAQALAGFGGSAEFTNQFTGLSVSQQVTKVYGNLLGRTPDAAGLLYWSGEITAGRETIGSLVLSMTKNALGKDVTTIADRVTYSTAFTAALDTTAEINAYAGVAATQAARDALLKVISASVGDHTALTAETAKIDATIAAIVSGGTSNPGQTFTLTANVDNIVGTAGNDTIIGGSGSAGTGSTLGSADVINGGAGTDKLMLTVEGVATNAVPNINSVEQVQVQALGTGGATVNLVNAVGVTDLINNNSTDALSFTNVQALAAVQVVKGNSSNTDVKFADVLVAGTADAVSVVLDNAKAGFLSIAGTTAGGFETVNINAAAGKSTVNVLSTTSGNVAPLAASLQAAQTDATLIGAVNVVFNTDEATTETAYATAVNATAASAGAKTAAITAFNAIQAGTVATTAAANTAGAASTTAAVTAAAAALGAVTNTTTKTINIEGAGSVKLGDIAETVTTIDASKNAGGVDVHIDAGSARDVTITGGSGDDQVRMENTLTTLDKVDGGAGRDTIHVTNGAALVDGLRVTNFEQLDVAVGAGTYNMSKLAGIDTLVVSNSTAGAIVVDNFAKGAKVVLGGENTAANLINAGGLTINVKDSGAGSANDVIDVAVNSKTAVTGGGALNIANIETVNIKSSSTNAGVTHNLDGATNLTHALTVNVNADTANLTIGNLDALALVSFDASASVKNVSLTTGADTFTASAGTAFKMGAGADVLILTGATGGNTANDADATKGFDFVITGGKGGDTITLAVSGAANKDMLVYAAGDSQVGVVAGVNQFDTIANFGTTFDKINLASFGFTGTAVSGLKAGAVADISTVTGDVLAAKTASFFGAGGDQRSVVIVDAAVGVSDVWVYVDTNKDGSFQAGTDMAIKLAGLADASNPVIGDFIFA